MFAESRWQRLYKEAKTCSHLNDNKCFVSFIGIYSTQDHPFALVFEFMDRLSLRGYLRDNQDIGRLELVRSIVTSIAFYLLTVSTPAIGNSSWSGVYAQRWYRPWKSQDCAHPCMATLITGSQPSRQMSLWAAMGVSVSQV